MERLKVAYPVECRKLHNKLKKEVMSIDEIQTLGYDNAVLDELMRHGLVKRTLVPINGIDYIYLEAIKPNTSFIQGRRNFARFDNV